MDQRKTSAPGWCVQLCVLAVVVLGATASARTRGPNESLEVRAERLLKVVASVTKAAPRDESSEAPLQVRLVASTLAETMPPSRLGWFDSERRTLIVQAGVPASGDDALFAMVSEELRTAFGEPAMPWFARGIAHVLIGSCAGFSLSEIESRTQPITLGDVLANQSGRSRIALAPAEARLARSFLAAKGGDVASVWKWKVDDSAEMEGELRASWKTSFERLPSEAALAYPRSVQEGAYVEFDALEPQALELELKRIASLGFAGVEFKLVVSAEPSAEDVATRLVQPSLLARQVGLSVVWVPSWGGATPLSPTELDAHSERRAREVESLSWIAEQGLVDGLVLFESAELRQPESAELSADVRAARRHLRRLSLEGSRPFAGDRLAFAADASIAESASAETFSAEFVGALAVVKLKVGIGDRMDHPAIQRAGAWGPAANSAGLRSLSDEELRAVARQ